MKRQYSILCVDDDENILRLIQRILILDDYDCYFAKSAEDALILLENTEIDIILADMKLPGMDGLELLRLCKEKWPLTVRVIISGFLFVPQIIAAINGAQIFRFVTKPWKDQKEFLEVINDSVEKFRELDEFNRSKNTIRTRGNTYKNMLKRANDEADAASHAAMLLGNAGKSILKALNDEIGQKIDVGVIKAFITKTQETYNKLVSLTSHNFEVVETMELMNRISSSMSTFESIKRVDVGKNDEDDLKIKVRGGLVEYAVSNLVDNMIPGIKKYVKIFMLEPENKFKCNIMVVVSPIHREENKSDEVKNHVHAIMTILMKAVSESLEGNFEFVNKGTKYLIKLEFPRYVS